MVREVQQAGKGAGPRRPAPLRGVEQPARAERHGPLCLRDDGRDDLGEDALMVREVLQSVIGSLRLRCGDPVARLTEALDAYALDKTFKIEDFLFPLQKA